MLDLLRRLDPAQAQAALDRVLTAMTATTNPSTLLMLAQAGQALPAQAHRRPSAGGARPGIGGDEGHYRSAAVYALARAVQAVAAKLSDAQAQAALDRVLTAMKGATDPAEPLALQALAQAVQALPAKFTEVQAQAALDPVLTAMKGTTDPDILQVLAQAVQALAPKLGARAGAALEGVWVGLARSGTAQKAKLFLEAADAATADHSFDQFAILCFDVLKYPTVTGEAEAYLLQRLRERSGGKAAEAVDLWSAVAWAERRGGIDVTRPPRRPGPSILRLPRIR